MRDLAAELTEPQRECLRLVLSHHSSKEIAARLGVSPSAVDKRIERAVQMLGASSRFAAARMLAAFEEGVDPACERLPCEPIDLPEAIDSTPVMAVGEPWWLTRRLIGMTPEGRFGGRNRNELGPLRRIAIVIGLCMIVSLTTMALLNVATTLSALLGSR